MKQILYYLLAFLGGAGLAYVSLPLTWPLLELALYYFGHKLGLDYNLVSVLYLICSGLVAMGCLALGQYMLSFRKH